LNHGSQRNSDVTRNGRRLRGAVFNADRSSTRNARLRHSSSGVFKGQVDSMTVK